MVIAGHQPHYLPNLAYFLKMNRVDLFVVSTNMRYERKDGWQRRNRIPTCTGDTWLTVPTFGSQHQQIKDVKIDNQRNWRRKHARILKATYAEEQGSKYLPRVLSLYEKEWTWLVDIDVAFISLLKDILDIKTKIIVDEERAGIKHTILINVCKKYGISTFLSGVGAKQYLTAERLEELKKHNITHTFIEKDLTSYKYSVVHYLLSYGKEWILEAIT